MRTGLLALLALLVGGAGVSLAQSYPGNSVFPALDPASNPAPASPGAGPVPSAPAAEAEFHGLMDPFADLGHPADCFWFTADYLLWWTKNGPLPSPLVTTGSTSTDILGGLTQPGTQILLGGSSQDYGTASGLRLASGIWLDEGRFWGLEGGYFLLTRQAVGSGASSDLTGNPVLAQPVVTPAGTEFTELIALPGLIQGGATATTHSRLQGWEFNGVVSAWRGEGLTVDLLAGFRAVSLDEDLQVYTAFSPLVSQFLSFQNQLVNTPSTLTTFDGFQASNHFYGPQLGGRVEWSLGRFTLSALGKVAVGDNQELVRVVGASSFSTPSGATVPVSGTSLVVPVATTATAPGGVLALPTNSGEHFRDQFAVLPEVGLQLTYQIARDLEVHVGYSFLYWSNVQRPGNTIDRTITAGLVPTDPLFGTATGTRPGFQFHSSDYWAQGLNFGLTLRF